MNTKAKNNFTGVISMLFLCVEVSAQIGINNQTPPAVLNLSGSQNETRGLMLSTVDTVSSAHEADWPVVSALLDMSSPTYTETWDDSTCKTLQEGAYLGNGDFGAHLGGTIHSLKYYLGKNGFHAGNDIGAKTWTQHILNLAILTIEKSSGTESGNAYSVTQDLKNAEIRTRFTMAGFPIQTKAYISDSGNALVLELSTNSGHKIPLQATLSVIGNAYVAKNAGKMGSVAWITKEPNADGAPFYVKGAVAAKVLGATALVTTESGLSEYPSG